MQVTATQIANWAGTMEARSALPRLIRRLIHAAGIPTQADFPAGDSVNLPGWDGKLLSNEHVSPWIPTGKSYWEFSCEKQATKKANQDYDNRTDNQTGEISDTARKSATLVIVSARPWGQKNQWLKEKQAAGAWGEIRAYNAGDLEQWLEQSPAILLQFAEELRLSGSGVCSIGAHWGNWSKQSDPAISAEALFSDRENIRERLIADVRERLNGDKLAPYAIKADSVEEAAAFVCAALLAHPVLDAASLVVTESDGWRFVEQNAALKVVVAARPEIAETPARRKGLVVIIPYAAGDMEGHYRATAGRDDNTELVLERPRLYEFEKTLASIGLDQADAKRLAASTGRSWSVFRRRRSTNPSIRKPTWLDAPQAGILSTLCLLGGWLNDSLADQQIVTHVSGRDYEDVERDLRYLTRLDDAPILQIGEVWKAKSPLELLDIFGDRITRGELDRFLDIARQILVAPDPQLDLPDKDRYAAQIYGKIRLQSTLFLRSLCDSLVKLAVRGMQIPTLSAVDIEGRIAVFVRDLLDDADGLRWLSLSTFLPSLAEAAPDVFLRALEVSLTKPEALVTRLLTETSESSFMGRCWHAGLLWALERLAWAPERLARVALILARLARVEIKGNWGNTPKASLLKILRSWLPQTAADLNQRIAVLDMLIVREPEVAFDLLDRLVYVGSDAASSSARPIWRGDDTGAGHGVTDKEHHQMLVAAADRLIAVAKGNPQRIARVIEKTSIFDPARIAAALALAEQFTETAAFDEDKETIRAALRQRIHWHRNYGSETNQALDDRLREFEVLYQRLVPCNLITRHCWLFADGWPNLPMHVSKDDYSQRTTMLEGLRTNALREIYAQLGTPGVEQLSAACPNPRIVGLVIAKTGFGMADLADWIVASGGNYAPQNRLTITFRSLLRSFSEPDSKTLIGAVLARGQQRGWHAEQIARFLVLAREERTTWDIVASCGTEVQNAFWEMASPDFLISEKHDDIEFALRRLLEAGRPRSALQVCRDEPEKLDANLIVEILERVVGGEEATTPLIDSWHIGKVVEWLEISGVVEKDSQCKSRIQAVRQLASLLWLGRRPNGLLTRSDSLRGDDGSGVSGLPGAGSSSVVFALAKTLPGQPRPDEPAIRSGSRWGRSGPHKRHSG